jgi:SM-20-related protein
MITCETLDPSILDHLGKEHWALGPAFFSETELQKLKALAFERWKNGQFEPAKVGRSQEQQRALQIRSDWTSWVDLKDPQLGWFSQRIDSLTSTLNQNFFLGLRELECHFARYAEGQFYEEHIDQSPQSSFLHGERVISFVLYLNENWQPGHGGELCLRIPEKPEICIEPRWGHLILFRSDTVPHAVLPATQERWSLTGWFRRS